MTNSPIYVVATLTAKPGLGPRLIEAFRVVSPLVHAEPGCGLYAANVDGDTVVMIEAWGSQEDLTAHANGAASKRLNELIADVVAGPTEIRVLQNVPLGDPAKGTIPLAR
jgi:quinol monooxygenase YgiN